MEARAGGEGRGGSGSVTSRHGVAPRGPGYLRPRSLEGFHHPLGGEGLAVPSSVPAEGRSVAEGLAEPRAQPHSRQPSAPWPR